METAKKKNCSRARETHGRTGARETEGRTGARERHGRQKTTKKEKETPSEIRTRDPRLNGAARYHCATGAYKTSGHSRAPCGPSEDERKSGHHRGRRAWQFCFGEPPRSRRSTKSPRRPLQEYTRAETHSAAAVARRRVLARLAVFLRQPNRRRPRCKGYNRLNRISGWRLFLKVFRRPATKSTQHEIAKTPAARVYPCRNALGRGRGSTARVGSLC